MKTFYVSVTKILLWRFAGIYRYLLSKCGFWVHRNGAVQMFYLTPTRDRFSGKFVKWVRFLAVLLGYISYNVELGEVCKMKFFERNCIALVSCLRFIWITNSSSHRRVWMNCESLAYKVVTQPTRPTENVSLCERSLLLVFVGFENPPENLKLLDKQLQIRGFASFIFWSKFHFLGLFQRILASL